MNTIKLVFLFFATTIAHIIVSAQTYVFAELNGLPINTNGWNMQGNASVGGAGNSEIILTEATNTQSGAIFFNTPINLSLCSKWVAEYEVRIADGTAADGIAFCYLDVPPSGFVSGGGVGIPATANGLKIVIDTYLNCSSGIMPKLEIRWGSGYDECNPNQPTRTNFDGAFSSIRNGNYQKFRVEYDNGTIRVFVNGIEYLTANQTFNFTGYFGFTASTGGLNDRHSIRNVKIYTDMPASYGGADRKLCPGESAQLGVGTTTGLVYNWSPATYLNASNLADPVFQSPANTTIQQQIQYIVQTEFANKPGCGSRDSVLITLLPKPEVYFTTTNYCLPNANVLFQDKTTLNKLPATGSGWKWNWRFNDPNATPSNPDSSNFQNPTHIFNAPNPNVQLTAISPDGCKADTTILVQTIYKKPGANFTIASPTCTNQQVQFNQTIVDPADGSGPISVNWDFGDGVKLVADNPAHAYAQSGNYTIKMYASAAKSGCSSDTVFKSITVTTTPKAQFTRSGKVCLDSVLLFTDKSTPGFSPLVNRLWTFSDGTNSTNAILQKTINAGGTFISTLEVTDNNGCYNILSDTLFADPAPLAVFGKFSPCINSPTQVAALANSNWETGDFNTLGLRWKFNDPASNAGNPDTVRGRQVAHKFINTGTYNISLLMTATNGCQYDTIFPLKIEVLPVTDFSISSPSSFCRNDLVLLKNRSADTAVFTAIYPDFPNNVLYDANKKPIKNGEVVKLLYGTSFNIQQSFFYIKMVNTYANTCSSEKLDSIRFLPFPNLVFSPLAPVCQVSNPVDLLPFAKETTGVAGNGVFVGKGVVNNSSFVPTMASPGANTISYIFKTSDGCSDTAMQTITVNPLPLVNAGQDKIVLPGGQTILNGSSSISPQSFNWQPTTYLTNANTLTPTSNPLVSTTYTLTVITPNGCSGTDSVNVKVLPSVSVPNAFSPNGDGINDSWIIRSLDSYPGCTVEVFDRYGRSVFSSTGYSFPWDGNKHNKPLPVGVYYYIINPKSGAPPINGSLTLLR